MKARRNKGYLIVITVEANGSRRTTGVHRIVCEAFNGPAPAGQKTCRHLDGSRSHNVPHNLAWGTQADNMQDCIRHGRYRGPEIARAHNPKRRGSAHHRAVISDVDVRTIRSRYDHGEKIVSIAADYALSNEQVSKIARRLAWSWVS